MEKCRNKNSNLTVVGHSLGGGLASAAYAVTGMNAFTFNSSGLHRNTVANYPGAQERYDATWFVSNLGLGRQLHFQAYWTDYDVLSNIPGFDDDFFNGGQDIFPSAIGHRIELDGPWDRRMGTLEVAGLLTSLATSSPWGIWAADALRGYFMVEAHLMPSVLHGLLVSELGLGSGSYSVDLLGEIVGSDWPGIES